MLVYGSVLTHTAPRSPGPCRCALRLLVRAGHGLHGPTVSVHPDGRAISLCEGVLRARYRGSIEGPILMTPGEVYELSVDLGATSNVFLAGHRVRLDISSSNFPRASTTNHRHRRPDRVRGRVAGGAPTPSITRCGTRRAWCCR